MNTVFLIIIAVIALVALATSVKIVNQYEQGLIIRLGKYRSTAGSGINFVAPFIESMIKVDMRERVINVPPQDVITEDNVGVVVDAVIYYKIVDPVKAEFEVENFDVAATTLAQTNLRNLIGDKNLDETLTARDAINAELRTVLDEATDTWGVKITRVEVQRIDPPQDITKAMSQQMKAEREKRAAILRAEGVRQSAILEAEGDAKSKILRADAEAKAVQKVAQAAEEYFTERAEKLRSLEVSEKVLRENTKWILPQDGNLVNLLNLSSESEAKQ